MYKSEFSIPFPSEREAEVAFNSLRVEVEPSRSKVVRVLKNEGSTLTATFTAGELRNLRVSVGGFFEHLILVTETIRQFG
jgi:tRNA threonylcarbamoyladenosine modification (KEOPS) complex  Pcc1 subunit